MRRFIPYFLLVASLGANAILASLFFYNNQNGEQFPYLSKRIFAEDQNDILINFIPLRNAMRIYVGNQPDPIGVYFEYLPSGTSIRIRDELEVKIASLIKVPTVMAIYKEIEKGIMKKTDRLTIQKDHIDTRFGSVWKKGEGATLTIEEAVREALQHSDNTASKMLAESLPAGAMDQVFNALDVPIETEGIFPILSAKNYSSILRSLYLASYLTKASSNEILDILTQTGFADRLVAGIPKGVPVAHKIGVFEQTEPPQNIHSDCGIIYVPKRPYILCIMTDAPEAKANVYMRELSKMTYTYVSEVNGSRTSH